MAQYGSEVGPNPPQQDMYAVDVIVGPQHDRGASPAEFTVGTGGAGEGGVAGGPTYPEFGDRIGF